MAGINFQSFIEGKIQVSLIILAGTNGLPKRIHPKNIGQKLVYRTMIFEFSLYAPLADQVARNARNAIILKPKFMPTVQVYTGVIPLAQVKLHHLTEHDCLFYVQYIFTLYWVVRFAITTVDMNKKSVYYFLTVSVDTMFFTSKEPPAREFHPQLEHNMNQLEPLSAAAESHFAVVTKLTKFSFYAEANIAIAP